MRGSLEIEVSDKFPLGPWKWTVTFIILWNFFPSYITERERSNNSVGARETQEMNQGKTFFLEQILSLTITT